VERASGDERADARQALQAQARQAHARHVAARLRAALTTPAPFVERLVHFWANHFAVSTESTLVTLTAGAHEADAIRPHVLGRFEDLLWAAVQHPAMLFFLDQASAIGPGSAAGRRAAVRFPERRRGLNENLAREILELHTLGLQGGYTQADVTELARALTGWTVEGSAFAPAPVAGETEQLVASRHGALFRPQLHEPGARRLLGRSYAEDGEGQARAMLRDLALHPATARHIAGKLARHFVADDPPPAVVDRLAQAFLRSGGELAAVYRALVASPEAWRPEPAKFKAPWEWTVSSLRAVGWHTIEGPRAVNLLRELGQPVWRPRSPAGFDDVAAAWVAPDALLRRVEAAQRLAQRMPQPPDARELAQRVLPTMGAATAAALDRADTPATALALLLVSPEFLRR
jgi:uncharacterized protein (DUF1800 family)